MRYGLPPPLIVQHSDRSFADHSGITKMLQSLGLSFDGRHHSGLDDSINIARIALELIKVRHFTE